MPLYIADYLADTRRLRAAEHGAYLLLIMEYWTVGSLPDDDAQLARIAAMTDREWRAARPIIEALFQQGWRHKRIDAELERANAKRERRVEAGKRGGNAKAMLHQKASNALASSSQPHSDTAQHVSEERAGAEPRPPEPDEGVEITRLDAACREAAGLESDRSPSLLDLSPIVALIDAGYRLESDILPKLREAKARGKRGSSWRYYVAAITDAKAINQGIPAKPETVVSPTIWITTDDPRWPDACAEAKRRNGKEPTPMGSRHEAGMGYHFPAEIVATATRDAASGFAYGIRAPREVPDLLF